MRIGNPSPYFRDSLHLLILCLSTLTSQPHLKDSQNIPTESKSKSKGSSISFFFDADSTRLLSRAEIFSYVIGGSLGHTDSMGNKETIDSTKVQFTSAGTGISHAEYNGSKDKGEFRSRSYFA